MPRLQVSLIAAFTLCSLSIPAFAEVPIYPADAADYWILEDGTDMRDFDDESRLVRRTGAGERFDHWDAYRRYKDEASIRWAVRDLDRDELIATSDNASVNDYGASVQKALVAGAVLWSSSGQPSDAQWRALIPLIGRSANDPQWDFLEQSAGGKQGMIDFAADLGYATISPWRHAGNQLNPIELTAFLADIHHERFPGAEAMLKLLSQCNTGRTRGPRFIPKELFIGGKTGTWRSWNNDMRFIEYNGKRYGIAVLTSAASNEKTSVVFGGLFREYVLGRTEGADGDDSADGIGAGGDDDRGDEPASAGCRVGQGSGGWAVLVLVALALRRRRS